jgi:aspartyl-tRNA(Asn)/glutamyl-tRNA(Gln) amidotransferase subunit C
MPLNDQELQRLALLARLEIGSEDAAAVRDDLERILEFVAQLQSIDTQGVEPLATALDVVNRWDRDEPRASLDRSAALSQAPKRDDECFLVPPVL